MNREGLQAVRWLLLTTTASVLGIAAVVAGTMALMMIWVSAKTAGLIWCGFMAVGVLAFGSWLVYVDAKWWSEHKR